MNKTFLLEPNEKHIQSLTFNFHDDICDLKLQIDTATYQLSFGAGKWQTAETNKRGPSPAILSAGKPT